MSETRDMALDAVLCYVDSPWAYFTTRPLAQQTGDDWNDAPYEHNAGPPYRWRQGDGAPWRIEKVAWDGPFETPGDRANGNSTVSVDDINAGHVAWLLPDRYASPCPPAIHAGTTLHDFVQRVTEAGGEVYFPLLPATRRPQEGR